MTTLYRFVIKPAGVDVLAPGRLQQHDGAYVVVAEVPFDQAMLLARHATPDIPVTVWAEAEGEVVGLMHAHKIGAKSRRGQVVELWALVHVPSIFEKPL